MVRTQWWLFTGISLLFSSASMAQMEDRAFIGETAGVVVTRVYPSGLDLGAKTQSGTLYRIAGIPIDVSGEGTRCGSSIYSLEIAENDATRLELRTPKGPVSNCPLPERQLKMMLPVPIPDPDKKGAVKRVVKLRFRRINAKGERASFTKVFRIDYVSARGKLAAVRISELSR